MKLFTTINANGKQRRVDFTSNAHTRRGLLRALADALYDEGITTGDLNGRKLIATSNKHHSPHVKLSFSPADDRFVWGCVNAA